MVDKQTLGSLKKEFQVQSLVPILIILQPAAWLLAIREQFRLENMGNTIGTIILGIFLGFMLYSLCLKLKITPCIKTLLGISFLATPYLLYILVLTSPFFNIGFFWLFFTFMYLLLGLTLFIRNDTGEGNFYEVCATGLAVVYVIMSLILSYISRGVGYSPDSYSYYDMSQHIVSSFGLVSTIRQYQILTELGISFPYLLPLLIFITNALTGFSIYSGNIINLVAALLSIYYLLKVSRNITNNLYPGLIASVVMVFNPEYMAELMAARAIPLSILCVLLIINVIVNSKALNLFPQPTETSVPQNKLQAFLKRKCIQRDLFFLGLIAGAGMVIRFDFIVISGLLGVALSLYFLRRSLFKTVPFYVLGLLVFTAPWIIYSISNFQSLWVSDNSGTLWMVNPIAPHRFFLPTDEIPTFFNDRSAWIVSRQNIFAARLGDLLHMLSRPINIIVSLGIIALGVIVGAMQKYKDDNPLSMKSLLILLLVIYVVKTLAIYLVGYSDMRYHTETIVIVTFIVLCHLSTRQDKLILWTGFVSLVFFVSITSTSAPMLHNARPTLAAPLVNMERVLPTAEMKALEYALMAEGQHASGREVRLLNLGGLDAFRFGAHTDILTFVTPHSLNDSRILYITNNFITPNYVYASGSDFNRWVATLSRYYLFNRVYGTGAFALTPLANLSESGVVTAYNLSDGNWQEGINRNNHIMLVENNPYNWSILENARALAVNNFSVGVISAVAIGDQWIHVHAETSVPLSRFAYPNKITVLQ